MPAGRSVSARISPSSSADSGVVGAGLTTIGAPTAMRRGDLVGHQVEREVERRDRRAPARAAPGGPARAGRRGRRRCRAAAASPRPAPGLLGGPAERRDGPGHLAARPVHRLAVLRGDERGRSRRPARRCRRRHVVERRRRARGRARSRPRRRQPRPPRPTAALDLLRRRPSDVVPTSEPSYGMGTGELVAARGGLAGNPVRRRRHAVSVGRYGHPRERRSAPWISPLRRHCAPSPAAVCCMTMTDSTAACPDPAAPGAPPRHRRSPARARSALAERRAAAVAGGVGSTLPVYVAARRRRRPRRRRRQLADRPRLRHRRHQRRQRATPPWSRRCRSRSRRFTHTCFMVTPYDGYVEVCEALNRAHARATTRSARRCSTPAPRRSRTPSRSPARATGRDAVVVFDHAYHGRTNLTMAMTAKNMPYKHGFGPFAAEVYRVPMSYPFRDPDGHDRRGGRGPRDRHDREAGRRRPTSPAS